MRCAPITVLRPLSGVSPYVRRRGVTEITMSAVEVREVNPPRGANALQWVLLTSEEVHTFNDCWKTIERYERRPLIEEYHKCLKTGCSVEERQYRNADRLAPVIGLLSVLAYGCSSSRCSRGTNRIDQRTTSCPRDGFKPCRRCPSTPLRSTPSATSSADWRDSAASSVAKGTASPAGKRSGEDYKRSSCASAELAR